MILEARHLSKAYDGVQAVRTLVGYRLQRLEERGKPFASRTRGESGE